MNEPQSARLDAYRLLGDAAQLLDDAADVDLAEQVRGIMGFLWQMMTTQEVNALDRPSRCPASASEPSKKPTR